MSFLSLSHCVTVAAYECKWDQNDVVDCTELWVVQDGSAISKTFIELAFGLSDVLAFTFVALN